MRPSLRALASSTEFNTLRLPTASVSATSSTATKRAPMPASDRSMFASTLSAR